MEEAEGLDASKFHEPLPAFSLEALDFPDAESLEKRFIDTSFGHNDLPPSLLCRTTGWTAASQLGGRVKPRELSSILALAEYHQHKILLTTYYLFLHVLCSLFYFCVVVK